MGRHTQPNQDLLRTIQLRLSDAQMRMMNLENDRTPTVPIYDDIENNPPSVALEGQVALSQADLKVWWYSNGAWHTCGFCWDMIYCGEMFGEPLPDECRMLDLIKYNDLWFIAWREITDPEFPTAGYLYVTSTDGFTNNSNYTISSQAPGFGPARFATDGETLWLAHGYSSVVAVPGGTQAIDQIDVRTLEGDEFVNRDSFVAGINGTGVTNPYARQSGVYIAASERNPGFAYVCWCSAFTGGSFGDDGYVSVWKIPPSGAAVAGNPNSINEGMFVQLGDGDKRMMITMAGGVPLIMGATYNELNVFKVWQVDESSCDSTLVQSLGDADLPTHTGTAGTMTGFGVSQPWVDITYDNKEVFYVVVGFQGISFPGYSGSPNLPMMRIPVDASEPFSFIYGNEDNSAANVGGGTGGGMGIVIDKNCTQWHNIWVHSSRAQFFNVHSKDLTFPDYFDDPYSQLGYSNDIMGLSFNNLRAGQGQNNSIFIEGDFIYWLGFRDSLAPIDPNTDFGVYRSLIGHRSRPFTDWFEIPTLDAYDFNAGQDPISLYLKIPSCMFTNVGSYISKVEFYVDFDWNDMPSNTPISTVLPPNIGARTYYGGTAPGLFDIGALTPEVEHEFVAFTYVDLGHAAPEKAGYAENWAFVHA